MLESIISKGSENCKHQTNYIHVILAWKSTELFLSEHQMGLRTNEYIKRKSAYRVCNVCPSCISLPAVFSVLISMYWLNGSVLIQHISKRRHSLTCLVKVYECGGYCSFICCHCDKMLCCAAKTSVRFFSLI